MANKIKVLSIDDSALIRQLLTKIVNSDPDLEMVATAANPILAEAKLKTIKPDIITLDIENDQKREVLVKDYQLDGIKRTIRHIDFYEIDRNKKIKTFVPIRIEGTPEGVRLGGGTLEQVEYELPIKAFPGSIPREITVDVTELKVGSSLHISDIKFPEGVDPVGDGSKAVVTVVTTQDEDTPNKGAAAEA